ncbi:hypothetical protein CCACVL1_03072 [Corchorus capsularis]|uniref:Uncharacterized protein n=1 Tax=Corchorus capsularis TaxID=210143 RepID=A0A1R3K378_COCAP|nr:hypothetical protein CCACVL1_03072 [Corchorus capsularis]
MSVRARLSSVEVTLFGDSSPKLLHSNRASCAGIGPIREAVLGDPVEAKGKDLESISKKEPQVRSQRPVRSRQQCEKIKKVLPIVSVFS